MTQRFPNLTGVLAAALLVLAAGAAPAMAQAPAAQPAAGSTAAQPPFDAGRLADQAIAQMRGRLRLTDDQIRQIRPLLADNMAKLRQTLIDYSSPDGVMFPALAQEFRATRENFRAKVEPILSPEQNREFMVIRHEVDQELRDTICDARLQVLRPRLALKPEQEPGVRGILCEDFEKKRDLVAGMTTSSGGPAAPAPPTAMYQKIQDGTEAQLQKVLTPEQMKSYVAYRDELKAKARQGS